MTDPKTHKPRLYIKSKHHHDEVYDNVHCPDCGELLYRVLWKSQGSVIEIKCRKCGGMSRNY